jgi:uncharacterized membrane protein
MQPTVQNADAFPILIMLAAAAIVAFWRTALKLLIVIVIAAIGYGVVMLWQNTHHVAG